MKDEVVRVGEAIGEHLDQIRALFKPGRCFALVSWHPGFPERDMVIVEPGRSMSEVVTVVQRRITDPTTLTAHVQCDVPVEGCDCEDCNRARS